MADTDMPRYRCHKIVRALKITKVSAFADGGVVVDFAEPGFEPCRLEAKMVARYMPVDGDYLVQYEGDGYRSISPARAFEDGYTRLEDPDGVMPENDFLDRLASSGVRDGGKY